MHHVLCYTIPLLEHWTPGQFINKLQAFSTSEMESRYTHGRLIRPASCAHPVLIPVCLQHMLDSLTASGSSYKELPQILHPIGVVEKCNPQVCSLVAQYSCYFLARVLQIVLLAPRCY